MRPSGICASLWAITVKKKFFYEYINIASDIFLYVVCFFTVGGVRAKRGIV